MIVKMHKMQPTRNLKQFNELQNTFQNTTQSTRREMKIVKNKIDGTFLIGVTFSNNFNYRTKRKDTSLIFDLGSNSFAFVLRGEY